MKFSVTKIVLGLCIAALLTSCASKVSIKETWRSPAPTATAYKKLLIIAITPRNNMRKPFENIFAETLSEHGVAAVKSHTLLDDLSKADRTQIQELARQVGADAVVITRVLSRSEHTIEKLASGSVQQQTVVMNKTDADSSTTVVMSAVGIVPGELDSAGAKLETRFFDAASAELVWSALSSAAGAGNAQIDICWKLSALLTKALSEERLIEINSKKFRQPSL